MIDSKKKCWREKVTAEITMAHIVQFAEEMGTNMSAAEVAEFLNQNGRAQDLWIHMMQAAEQFIRCSLGTKGMNLPEATRPVVQVAMIQ
jgi:hypothetical protein